MSKCIDISNSFVAAKWEKIQSYPDFSGASKISKVLSGSTVPRKTFCEHVKVYR